MAGRQIKLRILLDRPDRGGERITRDGAPALDDPAVAGQLARTHVALEVLGTRLSQHREGCREGGTRSGQLDRQGLAGRAEQRLGQACLDVMGGHISASVREAGLRATEFERLPVRPRRVRLRGSLQIQKNIIAQRILGLPRK